MKSASNPSNRSGRAFFLAILVGLVTAWLSGWTPVIGHAEKPLAEPMKTEEFREITPDMVRMIIEIESADEDEQSQDTLEQAVATAPEVTEPEATLPGPAPAIEGRFAMPVLNYVDAVRERAGGKLLIWDRAGRRAVGEVIEGQFRPEVQFAGFSSRARNLSRDLPSAYREAVLRQVRATGEFGIFSFVLVVPKKAERQFKASISKALANRNLTWEETDLLRLRYTLADNRVAARVETALSGGVRVDINESVIIW
jgi:hypothetical protein